MYLLVRDGTINGETKKIVFGIYDESSTNVTSALLLRSRELFNHYSARIYLKIAVLDGSVPVLTTTATQSLIACSGIYNTVKKHMRPDGGLDDKVAQADHAHRRQRRHIQLHTRHDKKQGHHGWREVIELPVELLVPGQIDIGRPEHHAGEQGRYI